MTDEMPPIRATRHPGPEGRSLEYEVVVDGTNRSLTDDGAAGG